MKKRICVLAGLCLLTIICGVFFIPIPNPVDAQITGGHQVPRYTWENVLDHGPVAGVTNPVSLTTPGFSFTSTNQTIANTPGITITNGGQTLILNSTSIVLNGTNIWPVNLPIPSEQTEAIVWGGLKYPSASSNGIGYAQGENLLDVRTTTNSMRFFALQVTDTDDQQAFIGGVATCPFGFDDWTSIVVYAKEIQHTGRNQRVNFKIGTDVFSVTQLVGTTVVEFEAVKSGTILTNILSGDGLDLEMHWINDATNLLNPNQFGPGVEILWKR